MGRFYLLPQQDGSFAPLCLLSHRNLRNRTGQYARRIKTSVCVSFEHHKPDREVRFVLQNMFPYRRGSLHYQPTV